MGKDRINPVRSQALFLEQGFEAAPLAKAVKNPQPQRVAIAHLLPVRVGTRSEKARAVHASKQGASTEPTGGIDRKQVPGPAIELVLLGIHGDISGRAATPSAPGLPGEGQMRQDSNHSGPFRILPPQDFTVEDSLGIHFPDAEPGGLVSGDLQSAGGCVGCGIGK